MQKHKNNEPRPKFTGSYKIKRVIATAKNTLSFQLQAAFKMFRISRTDFFPRILEMLDI